MADFSGDGNLPEDDYTKQRRLMFADVNEGQEAPINSSPEEQNRVRGLGSS
ncbi:hypothetical protein [Branchiibius sp. NY16-3462-2]|uniref:hypothetical protein n=1 Tax=Branchiibius sp. NY16-3462-2 TaxID=1807500 RepID=UPI0025C6F9EA|nr:hypothetical protein [Branchiibius sp. NY16-3462-2]